VSNTRVFSFQPLRPVPQKRPVSVPTRSRSIRQRRSRGTPLAAPEKISGSWKHTFTTLSAGGNVGGDRENGQRPGKESNWKVADRWSTCVSKVAFLGLCLRLQYSRRRFIAWFHQLWCILCYYTNYTYRLWMISWSGEWFWALLCRHGLACSSRTRERNLSQFYYKYEADQAAPNRRDENFSYLDNPRQNSSRFRKNYLAFWPTLK